MTDYYFEAVRSWQSGNKTYWHFAECAAQVDDRRTAALAADCGVSVDTVEVYRRAYKLFYEMTVNFETSDIYRMREHSNISLWIAAAKRRSHHDLKTLKDYLQMATDEKMTVEQLRVELDSRSAVKPEWTKRLQGLIKTLFKLRTDWKTEIPATKRDEFENWLLGFERWVKALAEEDERA